MKKIALMSSLGTLLIAVCLLFGSLFLNSQYQQGIGNKQESQSKQNLSIAIVNADRGVKSNGTAINLGNNYVTQASKDTLNHWETVSQGVAEAGLKQGDYQLLIMIPSDFSSKILNLNEVNPETTNVRYVVGEIDNPNIRAVANAEGERAISTLNQSLVNMYFVGILDNLYTAQNNVKASVGNENAAVKKYKNLVDGPTKDFQTILPNLNSTASPIFQSVETLQKDFNDVDKSNKEIILGQNNFKESFDQLIKEHAKGQVSNQKFYDSIASLKPSLVGEEIEATISKLKQTNKEINNQITGNNDSGENTDNLTNSIEKLQNAKADYDKLIELRSSKSLGLIDELNKLKLNYKTYINQYLTGDEAGNPKLSDLLNINQNNTETDNPVTKNIRTGLADRINLNQSDLNELVYGIDPDDKISLSGLGSGKNYKTIVDLRKQVDQLVDKINEQISEKTDFDGLTPLDKTLSSNSSEIKEFRDELSENYKKIKAGSSTDDERDDYYTNVGEIRAKYKSVINNLNRLKDDIQTSDTGMQEVLKYLDTDISEQLSVMITETVFQNIGLNPGTSIKYQVNGNSESYELSTFEDEIKNNHVSDEMTTNLQDVLDKYQLFQEQNKQLNDEIFDWLDSFSELQNSYQDVLNNQETVTNFDNNLVDLMDNNKNKLDELMSVSKQAKVSSESQIENYKVTSSSIKNFSKTLEETIQKGNDLNKNSNQLLATLIADNEQNTAFSKTFSDVLKNSHINGAINTSLVNYLSKPVKSSKIDTTTVEDKTINPIPWLIVLYAVSLFISYSWSQFGDRKHELEKQDNEINNNFKQNIKPILINLGSHLVLGIIFAIITASQLGLIENQIPIYALLVVVIGILFGGINGYLILQLKNMGLGIGLFILLSEMFLLNIADLKSDLLVRFINSINPISFASRVTTQFLANNGNVSLFLTLLILTITFVILNMLVVLRLKHKDENELLSLKDK